jgi:hypothetical protein
MLGSDLLKADSVADTLVRLQKGHVTVTAARIFAASAAADIFLQMFDAANTTDVTLGTTVPDWVVPLDSAASPVSGGDGLPTHGGEFKLGIVVACTTTPTGNTGSAAHVRVWVK